MKELVSIARKLNRAAGAPAIPSLFALTDPARTPDLIALARRIPRGGVVIYRHFGQSDQTILAKAILAETRRRGALLLIGADPRLAARIGADGVHLPERMAARARVLKRRRPGWLVTVAAHGPAALRRARGADAALLSPVFPSRSPSAGAAIGLRRARAWARKSPVPVVALGGVNAKTARALRDVAGVAAIDAFLET